MYCRKRRPLVDAPARCSVSTPPFPPQHYTYPISAIVRAKSRMLALISSYRVKSKIHTSRYNLEGLVGFARPHNRSLCLGVLRGEALHLKSYDSNSLRHGPRTPMRCSHRVLYGTRLLRELHRSRDKLRNFQLQR